MMWKLKIKMKLGKKPHEQDRESFIIYVASKETTYKVYKQHLVSIETKDKTAARKTSETTMTAIDALSNMGF